MKDSILLLRTVIFSCRFLSTRPANSENFCSSLKYSSNSLFTSKPFFRKKLIEDISFNNEFYDEDFFIYSEDLDVAFRSRLKGWKCLYIPTAIIYHKHNATAKKVPDLALYHYTKNKIFIIIKNYPLALLIKYSLVILLRQLISLIYYILKLRFSAVKSRIVVIYYLPKMLRKRWKIQRTKRVSNKELKKWLLPRPLLSSLFSN